MKTTVQLFPVQYRLGSGESFLVHFTYMHEILKFLNIFYFYCVCECSIFYVVIRLDIYYIMFKVSLMVILVNFINIGPFLHFTSAYFYSWKKCWTKASERYCASKFLFLNLLTATNQHGIGYYTYFFEFSTFM